MEGAVSTSLVRFPQREPGFLRSADAEQKSTSMTFGGGPTPLFATLPSNQLLPATKIDYAAEVGDGLGSSVLMAPLNWMMRTFPEAPAVIEKRSGDLWNEVTPHPLTELLDRPNEFYSGLDLEMSTVLDLCFGNAYWVKIRNQNREVVQLWWVPRYMMAPRWDPANQTFITHYDYFSGAGTLKIDVADVIHFRFGMDPRNYRLGLSPLGALARDVVMDDQAANFATAILKNLGVIGVVISPESGTVGNAKALEETKQKVRESFNGDRRGDPLTLSSPTKVQLLNYQMQGFDVSPLRDVSEERVCAALGIPAAVVGFGTGLQQTKVGATMKEMRQLAWTGGLIPMQKIIAKTISRCLLTENIWDGYELYEPPKRRGTIRMRFDDKQVRALWEDAEAKHTRVRADYQAGLISRGAALRETSRPAAADDDQIFALPVTTVLVDATGKPLHPPIPATTPDPSSTSTPANKD